jgi:TRAP-type C4-dicarboxylate transport system substrate-binding protein
MKGVKTISIVFIFLLLMGLSMLAGVQEAASAPTPIVLKFNSWVQEGITYAQCMDWYLTEVEKAGGGRIKFERYWSSSLVPARKELDGLNKKIVDIASVFIPYTPAELPLSNVAPLPVINANVWVGETAFIELNELPAIQKELAKLKVKFLAPLSTSSQEVITNVPINSIDDFKGLKIRATGTNAEVLKGIGTVPVTMATAEMYTSMERGTIQGVLGSISSHGDYKLHEVAKHLTMAGFGGAMGMMAINVDVWNKLPADIQGIMLKVGKEAPKPHHHIYTIENDGKFINEVFPKAGVKVTTLSATDKAALREKGGRPVWDKWANGAEEKGLPGKEVLQKWMSLYKKYEPLSPFK